MPLVARSINADIEMDQVGYGKGLKLVSLLLVKSLVEPFSPYRPYLVSGFAFETV